MSQLISQLISQYLSTIAKKGAKNKWAGKTKKEREEIMAKAREGKRLKRAE